MLSGAITVAKGIITIIGEYVVRDYLSRLVTSGFTFTHIRAQNETASSSHFSLSLTNTHTYTPDYLVYVEVPPHSLFGVRLVSAGLFV